jgi:Fic family protein
MNMFVPEYTITSKILRNISQIEYNRSIIENTTILPSWEAQLQKDAKIDRFFAYLQLEKINLSYDAVKKYIDGLNESPSQELTNLVETFKLVEDISINKEFDEMDIKYLSKSLCTGIIPRVKQGIYRSVEMQYGLRPQEILAEMIEFIDWHNTLEAKEEHPVVVAAITQMHLLKISPFEALNTWLSFIMSNLVLLSRGYNIKGYLNIEDYIYKTIKIHNEVVTNSIIDDNEDYTKYIEYISEQFADNTNDLSQKVKLLAKDTKVAKVSGRVRLTERQERIVEHLQDYGILQNKDFPKIFPGVSEDSVLRDLKALIDMGMVVKRGSTKSSRYELK